MSINNSNQPAVGVSEAQEAVQDAESAQPATVAAPFQVAEAAEAAATATAPEIVPASASAEAEAVAPATEAASADGETDAAENADAGDGDEMNFADILAAHEKSHSSEINEEKTQRHCAANDNPGQSTSSHKRRGQTAGKLVAGKEWWPMVNGRRLVALAKLAPPAKNR